MRISNFSKVFISILLLLQPVSGAANEPVRGKGGMVVSASDLASQVGLLILKRGGNAVDAAVATGFALAVTYPAAGNLGGGGYMVIHLADGRDIALDYRERAPLKATRDMFLDASGNFDIKKSTEGYTAAGIPGSVAGMLYALEKYGSMKPEEVIQPAIEIARDGFPLSYRLSGSIASEINDFKKYKSSEKVFSRNGAVYKEGEIFKQPDLAATLQLIKEKGRDGFYKGKTAELMIRQSQEMGGLFTQQDFDDYKVIEKTPVKGTYRGYDIISMPPSSAGGTALIEALNILENAKFQKDDWNSSGYIHILTEALKYVYADRSRYLGDDAFVKVPLSWLTSKEYGKEIFSRIGSTALASSMIAPGTPAVHESDQTTHYSIADKYGNAVSTTTTLNSSFGCKIVVDGAGFL
ncbi:MAG: gamma-glutamyltransferase, partial [Syntrophothermus sp.]